MLDPHIAQWPGGNDFHAEGILPDINVAPTAAGFASGTDADIMAAVNVLRQPL